MSVWKPAVTVTAILEDAGRFLFVEEMSGGRLVLNQPAGHLDPGESLIAACKREVLEETAHRCTPTALVGIYRHHYAPEDVTFLNFSFVARIDGIEKGRPLDAEILRLHWLSWEEIEARREEHRSPLVAERLIDYRAGRRYPLDILSSTFA